MHTTAAGIPTAASSTRHGTAPCHQASDWNLMGSGTDRRGSSASSLAPSQSHAAAR